MFITTFTFRAEAREYAQYTNANARRRMRNLLHPYSYRGTGGTTHGSRYGLKPRSEYHIQAVAIYLP